MSYWHHRRRWRYHYRYWYFTYPVYTHVVHEYVYRDAEAEARRRERQWQELVRTLRWLGWAAIQYPWYAGAFLAGLVLMGFGAKQPVYGFTFGVLAIWLFMAHRRWAKLEVARLRAELLVSPYIAVPRLNGTWGVRRVGATDFEYLYPEEEQARGHAKELNELYGFHASV